MNALSSYMEREGRTADEVAVDLSALLGRKIGPAGVRVWASRSKPPQAWADALGLPEPVDEPGGPEEAEFTPGPDWTGRGDPPGRAEGAPPAPPPGARQATPAPGGDLVHLTARKRLDLAYNAIGGGVSEITGNPGYGNVFAAYAPSLADAWVDAAKVSPNVAKVLAFLESGGPVGELVLGHLILAGAIIYVSGRGPEQLDLVYGSKFHGYRASAIAHAVRREAEAHLNGSGQAAAEGAVGEPAL